MTTDSINGNSTELRSAADDLSKRTEQQAAALEETSAALDEITAAVRILRSGPRKRPSWVTEAKDSAAESASVVRNAIDAMGRIEQASSEIGPDYQRPSTRSPSRRPAGPQCPASRRRARGMPARGFAVVAQEVRELRPACSQRAKDIKSLISKSGGEVTTGVKLVQATGAALGQIETRVLKINDHIHSIATAAREQATGLGEVSTAVTRWIRSPSATPHGGGGERRHA